MPKLTKRSNRYGQTDGLTDGLTDPNYRKASLKKKHIFVLLTRNYYFSENKKKLQAIC